MNIPPKYKGCRQLTADECTSMLKNDSALSLSQAGVVLGETHHRRWLLLRTNDRGSTYRLGLWIDCKDTVHNDELP